MNKKALEDYFSKRFVAKKLYQLKKIVRFLIKNRTKKLYKQNPYLKKISKVHFFSWFSLKENHEIAGIMNCEITKCGDPLYLPSNEQ